MQTAGPHPVCGAPQHRWLPLLLLLLLLRSIILQQAVALLRQRHHGHHEGRRLRPCAPTRLLLLLLLHQRGGVGGSHVGGGHAPSLQSSATVERGARGKGWGGRAGCLSQAPLRCAVCSNLEAPPSPSLGGDSSDIVGAHARTWVVTLALAT